jgi:hypothetical protein
LLRLLNKARASAEGLDPGAGVVGMTVRGSSVGRDELGVAGPAADGKDGKDGVALRAGVRDEAEVFWAAEVFGTGAAAGAGGWYPGG